jgi:hypothetical protein
MQKDPLKELKLFALLGKIPLLISPSTEAP